MADNAIALLIDAENIAVAQLPRIIGIAQSLGAPVIRRVVGDFSRGQLKGWQREAVAHGFSIDHEPSGGAGKNTADIRLTIVAMDIAASGLITGFCIASSDRDFSPLVRRLREAGHSVHGVGLRTADIALRGACTAYHTLDETVPSKSTAAGKVAPTLSSAEPVTKRGALDQAERKQVTQLLASHCDSAGSVQLAALGKLLREKHPVIAQKLGGAGLGKRLAALDAARFQHVEGKVVLSLR